MNSSTNPNRRYISFHINSPESETAPDPKRKRTYPESRKAFESEINESLFSDDEPQMVPTRKKPTGVRISGKKLLEAELSPEKEPIKTESHEMSIETQVEEINSNKIYFGNTDAKQETTLIGFLVLGFNSCNENWRKLSKKEQLVLVGEPDNPDFFEVQFNKSIMGYVRHDLKKLIKLANEGIVQCSLCKDTLYEVRLNIYVGKKENGFEELDDGLLMAQDEEENETATKKIINPQVAAVKELFETFNYNQLRKALIDNLVAKIDYNSYFNPHQNQTVESTPPKLQASNFAGNIYDPFVKLSWKELKDERKQSKKLANDAQNKADIFEDYRYDEQNEEGKSRKGTIIDEQNDIEDNKGVQYKDNQMVFKNIKLNKLNFRDPPPQMKCRLRDYQKYAINWMLSQEGKFPELHAILQSANTQNLIHPLYEEWASPKGIILYLNVYNGVITDVKPKMPIYTRGGILADDMGLGKTVMTIALMLSNPRENTHFNLKNFSTDEQLMNSDSSEAGMSSHDEEELPIKKGRFMNQNTLKPELQKPQLTPNSSPSKVVMGGNLIICPPILRRQWYNEIIKHTKLNSLTVLLYEGSNKKILQENIVQYDVVITSYRLLGEELRREHGLIINIPWHRVVLDEAHTTRNKNANWSRAVFRLKAKYRWVLTGTPTQNRFHDLYSLLHFLKIDPWGLKYSYWDKLITYMQRKQKIEYLHSALQPIMLRRTKEALSITNKHDIDLPPKYIQSKTIVLQNDEKKFYDATKNDVYNQFVTLADRKESHGGRAYLNLFQQLTQLRQICDHRTIVTMNKEKVIKRDLDKKLQEFLNERGITIDFGAKEKIPETQDNVSIKSLKAKIDALKKDQVDDCSICLSQPMTIAFTVCGHIFCEECIAEHLEKEQTCPICRKLIEKSDVLVFYRDSPKLSIETHRPSAKSTAVVEELLLISQKREKCVCFAQWMGMMDILSLEMSAKDIKFVRLDGKCSNKQRMQILTQFLEDQETTVLLISLMLGGVGLNLTQANHVLLVEPWWNPGVEIQAIERVHRIGQDKPVYVTRFICKDTIEERMIFLQEHKKGILNLILAQNSKDDINHLKYLIGFEYDPNVFK